MKYPEFKNKKVTIWGLGVYGNGPAAIEFFSENGAKVIVTDMKPEEEFKDVLAELKEYTDVKYIFGKNSEEDILNCDLLFRAPAIPIEVPLLQKAIKKGINVQMSEGFFLKHSPTKNVIGITGTKGKSSTSSYIFQVLQDLGVSSYYAGTPQNSAVGLLDKVAENDWVVLEISSWDCEGLDFNKISPKYSAITNISQDHLNRYDSYESYAMSKASIYKYQDSDSSFIFRKDNEFYDKYLELVPQAGSLNVIEDNLDFPSITSKHTLSNLTMAYEVLVSAGFEPEVVLQSLKQVKPPDYRQQEIGSINGVKFVNDTTATAPAAAIVALETYKDQNLVAIIGGATKNLDYSKLANYILETEVDYMLIAGSATDKMIELGLDANLIDDDFERIVKKAYEKALEKQGVVLLTPGTASFGMFRNEYDRGDQFNAIFEKIKNEN